MQHIVWALLILPCLIFLPGCGEASADTERISQAIELLGKLGFASSIVWGISIVLGSSKWKGK